MIEVLERIGINLSLSFIYILLFRHLITPTVIVNTDFQVIILYFLLALLISIFLEAWHYLIIDLIEYPKVTLTVIAIGMIVCLFIKNYICLFNYLFISSQMSAKPYFIGSTGILLLW